MAKWEKRYPPPISLEEYRALRENAAREEEALESDREILRPKIVAYCEQRLGHPLAELDEHHDPGPCDDCQDAAKQAAETGHRVWTVTAGGEIGHDHQHSRRWVVGKLVLCREHARSRVRVRSRQEAA